MRRTLKYFGLAAGMCLAFGMTACGDDDSGSLCGNGQIDIIEGEDCDGADLGGASCGSLYQGATGTLACSATCEYDDSACNNDCGNGTVDAASGEACDGTNLDGETCTSLGHDPGVLLCSTSGTNACQFNITGCGAPEICNNGTIEGTEDCDLVELGGATCASLGFEGGTLDCTTSCEFDTTGCYNAAVMTPGSPCDEDADCNGGICWLEVWNDRHWGQARGYCWERCDANGGCPLSGADGICLTFGSGSNTEDRCVLKCDMAAPSCGVGQLCVDAGGGDGWCQWGNCTANADCAISGNCELTPGHENEGWCTTPLEDCSNNVDDDFDGKIDCSDPECTGETNCPTGENCAVAGDEDGDGVADCDDGECIDLGICTGEICTPVAGADLTCGATLTGQSNFGAGSTDVINGAECVDSETGLAGAYFANEWGPEYTYTLTVSAPQEVTVTVSNYTGDHDVYILKQVQGGCDPRQGCFAWGGNGAGFDEVINFTAYPGMTYYVVVDGFEGNESTFDISMACASTGYEDCGNSTDDDGDGLVDCDDPECWGVGACSTETDCGNDADDDLDGAIDCADSDCVADVNCLAGKGYWELWERDGGVEFDMEGYALGFTADTSTQGYTVDATAQATWLYTPGDGSVSTAVLTLDASDNTVGYRLDLPFTGGFPFQGNNVNRIYVIDNGYVSLTNEGGWMPGPTGWNVYQFARIGPLWTDLDPTTGTIIYDVYPTFVVITWDGLMLGSTTASTPNQFQLALHENGNIQMNWIAVDAVANQPLHTEGMVTIVGAEVGVPPTESNFVP